MLNAVLDLAAHGLTPVRLHYPIFGGDTVTCSCGNPKCPENSRGKHPVEREWGKSATQDPDVLADRWSKADWNVGIILGICHGIPADQAIIDIEDDSPEGREFADTLLGDYPTPSYSSGKSIHRIYRWQEGLPAVANMTLKGLEFRFGGKGRETQSVAPPSLHRTGAKYEWLPGLSLDDLPIATLPEHVVEFLNEEWARTETTVAHPGTASASKFRSPMGKIGPGARHHSLLTYANSLWRLQFQALGINGIDDQKVVDQVWMQLAGANLLVCDPPKEESEVEVIFRSSQSFMRKEFERELNEALKQKMEASEPGGEENSFGGWLSKHGIALKLDPMVPPLDKSPDRIDEWQCQWGMSYIVKGDEETIELRIKENTAIQLTLAEFENPTTAARRIQQETGGDFRLNKTFAFWDWPKIWEGKKNDKKGENGITRGLKEFLRDHADVKKRSENSLVDQVEEILWRLVGPKETLIAALGEWNERGRMFSGRLKMSPMGDGLTNIKLPEDPHTGIYFHEDTLWLMAQFSEINGSYRKSFGGGVTTRHLTEALHELGLERKQFSRGPLEGRWFLKKLSTAS